jgi:Fe-S cluster assembly ATP-binding protein
MLNIQNLHAAVDGKTILKGLTLEIKPGEIHAIMGPNGTGKSTLSHILAGKEGYEITEGSIEFDGKDLTELEIDERAQAGIFLAFQYPVEIPGVSSMNFLKSSVNAVREANGEEAYDGAQFLKLVREKAKEISLDPSMLKRSVNQGFSGGEKKRFETLQMMLLQPKLGILDETDSGLDIDALRNVGEAINALRSDARSFLMITHYQRLLDHVQPDVVHIMNAGRIVKSGGMELAEKLEQEGYEAFGIEENAEAA